MTTSGQINETTEAAQEAIRLLSTEISRFAAARVSAEESAAQLSSVRAAIDRVVEALGNLRSASDEVVDELRQAAAANVEKVEKRTEAVLESLERLQVSGVLSELAAVEGRLREPLTNLETKLTLAREAMSDVLTSRTAEVAKVVRDEGQRSGANAAALQQALSSVAEATLKLQENLETTIRRDINRVTKQQVAVMFVLGSLIGIAIVFSLLSWLA